GHLLGKTLGESEKPAILETTFTPIALGVLLAHLLHGRKTFAPLYRLLGECGACLVLGTILFLLIAYWPTNISGLGRLLIQGTMMLILGSLVVREDHWAWPWLKFPPLAYLGAISYGAYLYHMWAIHPVRVGFERFGWSTASFAFFVAAVLCTMMVAG